MTLSWKERDCVLQPVCYARGAFSPELPVKFETEPAAPPRLRDPRLRVWRREALPLAIDLLISLKVPFLAMNPSARRCLMAFLPAACFLREMMRPWCFIRSFLVRPPGVCFAVPWKTWAFEPTAGMCDMVLPVGEIIYGNAANLNSDVESIDR